MCLWNSFFRPTIFLIFSQNWEIYCWRSDDWLVMMNIDVKGWIITIVDDNDKGRVREWCNNRNVDRTDLVQITAQYISIVSQLSPWYSLHLSYNPRHHQHQDCFHGTILLMVYQGSLPIVVPDDAKSFFKIIFPFGQFCSCDTSTEVSLVQILLWCFFSIL